jgi:hypothetical protein
MASDAGTSCTAVASRSSTAPHRRARDVGQERRIPCTPRRRTARAEHAHPSRPAHATSARRRGARGPARDRCRAVQPRHLSGVAPLMDDLIAPAQRRRDVHAAHGTGRARGARRRRGAGSQQGLGRHARPVGALAADELARRSRPTARPVRHGRRRSRRPARLRSR